MAAWDHPLQTTKAMQQITCVDGNGDFGLNSFIIDNFHYIDLKLLFKKYKTFSVLIYSYINTSGNWKNEKLCGNTTPEGRSVFTQFRVFPISTSVDITIYQHGKCFIFFL